VIRIITRRSLDVQYLMDDQALELEGVREGTALWHPLGERAHPEHVLERGIRSPTTGFDLIVAAPRPVSALLAVGSHEEQLGVVQAHRQAVRSAMAYLNDRAVVVHRQILGEKEQLRTHWGSSASFTHGVNRAGEPHLHDHVLVGPRGPQYSNVIDATVLRDHARSADSLYCSELRMELNLRLERDVWRSFAGREYVAGIDESMRALWPGRANDVMGKLHWTREAIEQSWRQDLSRYESGPQIVPVLRDSVRFDPHRFHSALSELNVIRRQELVGSLADAFPRGERASVIDAAVTQALPDLLHEPDRALSRRQIRDIDFGRHFSDGRDDRQRSRERELSISVDRSRDR
jgi:hypothetical protein